MPASPDISRTADSAQRLTDVLRQCGPVAVAFSGGVDSAVVAKAAVLEFGDQAVAVTAVSPSLAQSELTVARAEAAAIGIRHVEILTDEFTRVEYRANSGDRCFFCKDTLYGLAQAQLAELGVRCLVNGANVDDLGDHRPGMRAAANYNVRSPLVEAGISKAEVRALARLWQLSVAEKPASPCLSSRIAYGVEVTAERVRRIELAEAFLRREFGLTELRVRLEADDLARIEVPLPNLPVLVSESGRAAVTAEFRRIGFRRVTLDLEGFRSGSLNDSLPVVPLNDSAP